MKRLIDINIKRPKKQDKKARQPQPDIVWPTLLPDDEDESAVLELRFYDLATVWDGSQWVDAPLWNNDDQLELLWEWTKSWTEADGPPFDELRVNSTYYVYGNESARVRTEAVYEQFRQDNTERWNRKPLGARPAEWETEDRQWSTGGTFHYQDPVTGETTLSSDYSMFNPLVMLKSTTDSEPRAIIDPDMYHQGIAKRLKMKWAQFVDEIKPLIYYCSLPPSERYGIEIRDQTKSFGHYLLSGGDYAYDWINGPYFCHVDTTNSDEFKITMEPDPDADEYESGRILQSGRKWDIFWAPRRWFFEARYYQHDNPTSDPDWLQRGETPVSRTHYIAFFWGRWPCDFSPSWGLLTTYTPTARIDEVDFYNVPTATRELVWMETYSEAKDHAALAGVSEEEIDRIETGGTTGNTHVVWSDSDDYMRITSSGTIRGKMDGVKNDQFLQPPWTYADNKCYEARILTPDSDSFGMKRLWAQIEASELWTGLIKPMRDQVIHKQDELITDCSGPSPASRVTHIPFGIGVSPSKANDLVAIIKTGEKAFFVWRRTDETFDEHIVGGASNRGAMRFESNRPDGRLDHYSEQANPDHGGWVSVPHYYDADYADMFDGPDNGRTLEAVGRQLEYEAGTAYAPQNIPPSGSMGGQAIASGDGEIVLDTPVWIIASKERALGDVYWGSHSVMDLDADTGDPVYAPGETAYDIHGRNGALRERVARTVFLVFETWYNASYKAWHWLNGL